MVLVVISLCVFFTYLVGMYVYFGIPVSISDTYYKLENRRKGAGWFFTAMCWGVGFPLLPYLLDVTSDAYQVTAFLACTGLLFVGAAPQFKLSLTGPVHYVSAAICCISSQVWVGLVCWWVLLPVWTTYLIYIIMYMVKHQEGTILNRFVSAKPMFWVEIASLVATFLAIFF